MTNIARIVIVGIATLALWFWLSLIGSQQEPLLLLLMFLAFFGVISYLLWHSISKRSFLLQAAIGAVIGYAASVVSAAANEVMLRGLDQFVSRDFTQNLYLYPTMSLGWLYGAVVLIVLCWRHRALRNGNQPV